MFNTKVFLFLNLLNELKFLYFLQYFIRIWGWGLTLDIQIETYTFF